MEGRRAQFVDEVVARRGAHRASRPRPSSTPRSTAGSGTPAGPTSSRRCSAPPTRSPGPYFNFSVPEPTGVVAVVAPQESSLLGLVSVRRAGRRDRQHRRRRRVRAPGRSPAITLSEVLATSDVPGGVVNLLTGRVGRDRAVARRAHGRQRDRPRRASTTPTCARDARGRRGRQRQARAASRHRRLDRRPRARRGSARSSRPRPSGTRSVSDRVAADAPHRLGGGVADWYAEHHAGARHARCSTSADGAWALLHARVPALVRAQRAPRAPRPGRRGADRLGRRGISAAPGSTHRHVVRTVRPVRRDPRGAGRGRLRARRPEWS